MHTLLDSPLLSRASSENLCTLIRVLSERLFELLSRPKFGAAGAEGETREALNCLRVLGRVVPFLPSDRGLEEELWWRKERVRVEISSAREERTDQGEEEGQFVLEDDEEEEEAGTREAQREGGGGEKWEEMPPLAERLLTALVDLAFVPGFTVVEECRTVEGGAVSYVIW